MTGAPVAPEPRFDSAGPRGAPVIVLVHGAVVTRKMWGPQLRGLASGYQVVAPDLPGHGERAEVPFTFAAAVDDLAALIHREAHGRALVVGLSLGGYVATCLAHTHPGLVSGLVLSGCSVNFVGVLGLYLKCVSALMRWGWLTQSRARAVQKTRRLFPAALAEDAEAQIQAGVYPGALGSAFSGMAGRDFAVLLGEYPGPTLILNGERDRPARRGEARFAAALQRGRVEIVSGAGHACSLDQPEAYERAIRRFAASVGWTPNRVVDSSPARER